MYRLFKVHSSRENDFTKWICSRTNFTIMCLHLVYKIGRGVDMSRHRARERREARDNKDTSVIYKENSCLDRKLPTLLLIDTRLFFYSVHIYNKPPSPEKLFS